MVLSSDYDQYLDHTQISPSSSDNPNVFFRKTSLVDYPGKLAAVIFFPHCNLRCPWCHNRDLVLNAQSSDSIPLNEALGHIAKRCSVLGGVVLSGGEPTLVQTLPQIIQRIKALNLEVKLDTNGTNPAVLKALLQNAETQPNYIACDLKIGLERYGDLLGTFPRAVKQITWPHFAHDVSSHLYGQNAVDFSIAESLRQSISLIQSSTIAHEFRSIILPDAYFSEADIDVLSPFVRESRWYFRPFIPGNCLNPAWNEKEKPSDTVIQKYAAYAQNLGKNVIVP
jgi:pyruvate formate lyase activating enzyme